MAQTIEIKNGQIFTEIPGMEAQPVRVWETDGEGKRRPTEKQEMIDGEPVWEQQVILHSLSFGRSAPEIVAVRWAGAKEMPTGKPAGGFPAPRSE